MYKIGWRVLKYVLILPPDETAFTPVRMHTHSTSSVIALLGLNPIKSAHLTNSQCWKFSGGFTEQFNCCRWSRRQLKWLNFPCLLMKLIKIVLAAYGQTHARQNIAKTKKKETHTHTHAHTHTRLQGGTDHWVLWSSGCVPAQFSCETGSFECSVHLWSIKPRSTLNNPGDMRNCWFQLRPFSTHYNPRHSNLTMMSRSKTSDTQKLGEFDVVRPLACFPLFSTVLCSNGQVSFYAISCASGWHMQKTFIRLTTEWAKSLWSFRIKFIWKKLVSGKSAKHF